jgi:hypothetical protein
MYKGDQIVCMCVFCVLLEAHCVRVVIAFEFFLYFKPTLRGGLRFLKFQKHLKKKKKGTVEQVSKTISKAVQIPFIIAA